MSPSGAGIVVARRWQRSWKWHSVIGSSAKQKADSQKGALLLAQSMCPSFQTLIDRSRCRIGRPRIQDAVVLDFLLATLVDTDVEWVGQTK
jgi:hypothetical protein